MIPTATKPKTMAEKLDGELVGLQDLLTRYRGTARIDGVKDSVSFPDGSRAGLQLTATADGRIWRFKVKAEC